MQYRVCPVAAAITGVFCFAFGGSAGETPAEPGLGTGVPPEQSVPLQALIKRVKRPPVATDKSPAELKIDEARAAIKAAPDDFQARNALALALSRRARETGDSRYYDSASAALDESLRISPGNPEAQRLEIWLLLGRHDFPAALKKARALNEKIPDDPLIYALLTDAAVEMGNYDEAETAVQWSFDLQPGDISGLTRGAYLRELFGDTDGALELMRSAYDKTALSEVEDRAWILTQMAHLHLISGKPDTSEQLLTDALKLFPDYHYALATLGKVRMAQGKRMEAVEILQNYLLAAPCAESLFAFAEGLYHAGQKDDATNVFQQFEKMALRESTGTHNHNRELAFYFADYGGKPSEALRFAEMEIARRQDVNTLHAHAWALYVSGKFAEARRQMERALAVGVRHPVFFYHAGMIASKAGDAAGAARHLKASLALAPQSEVAEAATRALSELIAPASVGNQKPKTD